MTKSEVDLYCDACQFVAHASDQPKSMASTRDNMVLQARKTRRCPICQRELQTGRQLNG